MKLPADHALRFELNNEVHARPPEAMSTPTRIGYIALLSEQAKVDPRFRDREAAHLAALCRHYGVGAPGPESNHFSADLGPFRLRWERHTEFSRYMFIVAGQASDPFAEPVLAMLPKDWLAALPGSTLVAAQAAILGAARGEIDHDALAKRLFAGNHIIGAQISGGAGVAVSDLRIHPDGMSRFLILDHGLAPRAAGRLLQRLMEIETYRMMALLALPVARDLGPFNGRCERELSEITARMVNAPRAEEETLLGQLTRLEAAIESRNAETQYRFSAAEAYYELVQNRITELREERIEGLQTFREFMERRLSPAMSTCRSVSRRIESVSERVGRSMQMLSTRVDIAREKQNQLLLETMSRRARMQLRLQQTVESLSVAAITYYIVGLVGYAAKGVKALGLNINPDFAVAAAIPIVLAVSAFGLKQYRRRMTKGASDLP